MPTLLILWDFVESGGISRVSHLYLPLNSRSFLSLVAMGKEP